MFVYLSKINVCSATFIKNPLTKYVPAATVTAEPVEHALLVSTVNDSCPDIKLPSAPLADKFSPSVKVITSSTRVAPALEPTTGVKYFTNKVIGSSPTALVNPITFAVTPEVAPVIVVPT